jgi:hypothetical protein
MVSSCSLSRGPGLAVRKYKYEQEKNFISENISSPDQTYDSTLIKVNHVSETDSIEIVLIDSVPVTTPIFEEKIKGNDFANGRSSALQFMPETASIASVRNKPQSSGDGIFYLMVLIACLALLAYGLMIYGGWLLSQQSL